jgi:predicted MFS family arabinose efflux permease
VSLEAQPDRVGSWRGLLFSITAGVLVANIYYVQPLLGEVAGVFGHDVTSAGYLVTFTQLGYAAGIFLIVPLGDVIDRRGLLTAMLAVNILGLLATAAAQSYAMFAAASLVVGVTSCATMVIVPYAAFHAPDAMRGRIVGRIMTGLLLGILLARTVSGTVSAWTGWRSMYALAALAILVLLVLLRAAIHPEPGRDRRSYPNLLLSLLHVARMQPELRRRTLYAMLGLCVFSMLWTGLTFLLGGPPYAYSEATIGLFGLVGAAGAAAANVAGRLADRGHDRAMLVVLALVLILAWAALALGATSLPALIAGIFLLDIGVMGLQVTHQGVIYRLAPEARSRVTAIFMTGGFIGASAGSALASAIYRVGGWPALCSLGAILSALILVAWAASRLAARRSQAA